MCNLYTIKTIKPPIVVDERFYKESAMDELSDFVVELLLRIHQDAQHSRHEVVHFGRRVQHDFGGAPHAVAGDGELHDLGSLVHLVDGLEDSHAVVVGDVVDAGHRQVEELLIFVVVEVQERTHLILEDDVLSVVEFGH